MKKLIITFFFFYASFLLHIAEGFVHIGSPQNSSLCAQSVLDSMTLVNVGEYKPTIMDANKMSDIPSFRDSTKKIPVSPYSINSQKIVTNFNVSPIQPAQMVGEPLVKLYNALVKVGMGTYTSPYAEVFYNSLRSKTTAYGVRLKHLSSSSTLKNYGYSGFSDNEINVYGKQFLKEHTLSANFDYARNVVHFYGYDALLNDISRDATLQRFNSFATNANLISHYSDKTRINHDVKLLFNHLSDKYNASENNIKALAQINTALGKELLKVNASVDYYNYKTINDTINNTIALLNPNFVSVGEKYKVNLGFTGVMDMFVQSKFYFYPNVELSYNVIDNIIVPFIGLSGGLKKNSYNSFVQQNPFITSSLPMQNTNTKFDFIGGIRGTLSSNISFSTSASFANNVNMPLFINDTADLLQNKFTVIYDDASVVKVAGELAYQQREKLRFILKGEYNSYKVKNELRAWYTPQLKFSLSTNYNLRDKIVAKMDLFYIDKQFSKTFETDTTSVTGKKVVAQQLKGIFDANIGVEYRYTKRLGLFLNFNNIANMRYYRWSNYPTQRFNLMGGLSYSF